MTGGAVVLRRAAIFTTVVILGIVLARLLGGGRAGTGPRPSLTVTTVPSGTAVQGTGELPGLTIVGVENPRVGTVRPVVLDDGTVVDFRPVVFRGRSEHPLPSPAPGVERIAVEEPVVEIREEPRTREELAAGGRGASRFEAPRGVLERGPGENLRMRLSGGVVATSDRDGTPWTFRAPEAEVDVKGRVLTTPGEVEVASRGLRVRGRELRADEGDHSILLRGGAEGTVDRATGAGLDPAAADGSHPIRFRSAGPARVLPLDPPAGGAAGERFRILLDRRAEVAQADGRLEAEHIEIDLAREPGGRREEATAEEIRAHGSVTLDGGAEGRRIHATCGRLAARPTGDGATAVRMEESPSMTLRLSPAGVPGGPDRGSLAVRGTGPATFLLPREDGPVLARFTGGARAVQDEPGSGGAPPVHRDLRAREISVDAVRAPGGPGGEGMEVRRLVAEGEAHLEEGPRIADAGTIRYEPLPAGGSIVLLTSAVAVSWPAVGALDPLAALGGERGEGPAPPGTDPGTLLLASPGTVRLEVPAAEERGATLRVAGGGTLRRVLGERELYRLTGQSLEADLAPGRRAVSRLVADGSVRFAGRGEGPGGRRYAFTGRHLSVTVPPGEGEGGVALLEGEGAGGAVADLQAEDGRPFRVAGDALRFDRGSGRFRTSGKVVAEGILPGGSGLTGGGGEPRRAVLECRALEGTLVAGGTEGSSRVSVLDARGGVRVRTEAEDAAGESLHYDDAAGAVRLRGSPAVITARAAPEAGPAVDLRDRSEAPEFVLTFGDGALVEARAEGGGRFLGPRVPPPPAGGGVAPPAERVEGTCRGPLVHRPGETSLSGEVALVRSVLETGAFREKDRLEGADEVRAFHPADAAGSRVLERAVAVSAAGNLRVRSAASGWDARGVSRVELDGGADRVTLEASREVPRFRVTMASGASSWFRRAVYDYRSGSFPETVGVTVRGE